MKTGLAILALLIVGAIAFAMISADNAMDSDMRSDSETADMMDSDEMDSDSSMSEMSDQEVVAEGTYTVQPESSIVHWAGQKPLIDGYINSGSIGVTEGSITVLSDTATGEFTIDMNTLSVSETPTKPGQESTLESHLKGERWFDVATYPEAQFTITEVTPRADSNASLIYNVTGELTMKGTTDTLTFPATIYQDANGLLHASADFEFDRTTWGITANSGSFFDNLADNVIDDMVALSFELVAEKQ